jgi:hypothetical protein
MTTNARQRVYYGPISTDDMADALTAAFSHGNLQTRRIDQGQSILVQIASPAAPASGGRTALAVQLVPVEDGVMVRIGPQEWLGVLASLSQTALMALLRPASLFHRVDDLAQDVSALQLSERVWEVVEAAAKTLGASHQLSERLRRVTCAHCHSANPVGEPSCIACGAPLGLSQPNVCANCGQYVPQGAVRCPECGVVAG